MNRILTFASALTLALAPSPAARAQAAAPLGPRPVRPVFSMGQPPLWGPYFAGLGLAGGGDGAAATLLAGVHHAVTNPVTGILGGSAEAYATLGGVDRGAGLRLLATSRIFALAAGADWNVSRGDLDLLISYQSAIRRGGLLGGGTMVRVDWLPTRHQTFGIGLSIPVRQPFAGRTRPRRTDVRLP
ncbi:MAG TPA: hypothetical protein VJU87_05810, partial [Gemmatimonadaceae bacterium]|nr:hypothetical protein [Gemmatimonadaceae bacterium]